MMPKKMNVTDAAIALAHWDACSTCKFNSFTKCIKTKIELSVYLGEWIICDDYEKKQSIQ